MNTKSALQDLFRDILTSLNVTGVDVEVAISPDAKHGEYTTNIAMRLAKQLKKSPMDIALQVKDSIQNHVSGIRQEERDQKSSKKDQKNTVIDIYSDVLQAIDKVEVAPPGFINVFLTEASLGTRLQEVTKVSEAYGTSKSDDVVRVTVEFTDPNPFKEFHIGHLYSNSVGESLSRLLESQGHTVRRVNYQGDVGMHVAKAMYGLLHTPDIESKVKSLEADTLTHKAQFLGAAYASGAKAFEEDVSAAEEMKMINKLAFIAAQQMWEKQGKLKPIVDYRGKDPIDQDKLTAVAKLYETGRAWSLAYFETIYKRLGTSFSGYYFESAVGERGVTMVRDHIKDGIFEESDGAIIYRGEKKGLHTRVFINQLGLPTYETKELGLAPTKYDDWAYDKSLIVTGNEINEYFKVLRAALAEIRPELAEKTRHLGHGMVRKSDGTKMSSRSGVVLTGEGLLDEVKESIYMILDKNKSNYSKADYESIAETTAVAAVKYSLLRVSLPSDVAFDVRTSVSFDGDSGPYLLYTYARCKSVLRKAGVTASLSEAVPLDHGIAASTTTSGLAMTMNPEEHHLARLIYFFPEIVSQAAEDLAPNVMCTYLFNLAQAFNLFYQKHPILDAQDATGRRLLITEATSQVLHNGLHLLGIDTVEKM